MKAYRYVTLDPTGNLTCLVLDPVLDEDRKEVIHALIRRCEQVGFLLPCEGSGTAARLEMMGGEFCANASMAAACYLARERSLPGPSEVLLEVSGASKAVPCRVRPLEDGTFEGTVTMPPVVETAYLDLGAFCAEVVRLEGIAHVILEDIPLEKDRAEALLLSIAEQLPDPAAGLLLWDSKARFLRPLVYVRESGTLIWESGCGSGSTALGVCLALRRGDGVTLTDIRQPGGTLRASVSVQNGTAESVRLSGIVKIGETGLLSLSGTSCS